MTKFLLDLRTILRCRHVAGEILQRNARGELSNDVAQERIHAIHQTLSRVRATHWTRALAIDLINGGASLTPGVRLLLVIAVVYSVVKFLR